MVKTRVVITRKRSWDCFLLVFERHNSPGDKTVRQEQEGMGEGGAGCVEYVHAVIVDKTATNCHARRLNTG